VSKHNSQPYNNDDDDDDDDDDNNDRLTAFVRDHPGEPVPEENF